MTLYAFVLVLHALGAVAIFASVGIEGAGLVALSSATTPGELRLGLAALAPNRLVAPVSGILTILSGLYIAHPWGPRPWLLVSLVLLVPIAVMGSMMGRRTARLRREVESAAAMSLPRGEPVIARTLAARIVLFVGIVLLMVEKPELVASLVVGGVAVALALLAGQRAAR
jgi:hypothetical protein